MGIERGANRPGPATRAAGLARALRGLPRFALNCLHVRSHANASSREELNAQFDLAWEGELSPHYNIAPSHMIAIVRAGEGMAASESKHNRCAGAAKSENTRDGQQPVSAITRCA